MERDVPQSPVGTICARIFSTAYRRPAQSRVESITSSIHICTLTTSGGTPDPSNGTWQPTFPAARYVMSAEEFRYWQSVPKDQIADQHAGFTDSVLPVFEAGLVGLVTDDHVVTEGVRLLPTPGHTPHHVSVIIESRGQSAVITGDVMHHPCQIAYPAWGASDFDGSQAQASRLNLIERFADSDTLIIGTHFADPVAGRIRRKGSTFRLTATGN